MTAAERWAEQARRDVLAELLELRFVGFAANVQKWARVGRKKDVAECKARRRTARKLLELARRAVQTAELHG